MCGIIGSLGFAKSHEVVKFLKTGLFIDTIRGFDSTGVACCYMREEPVDVVKSLLSGSDFIQTSKFDKVITGHHLLYIGHNRAATRGNVSINNAHPFTEGDVTLVHNGTLNTWQSLTEGYFSSDSQAITKGIADAYDIPSFLEKLDGAFALAWFNNKTKVFNLARNDKRPMVVAWIKGQDHIVFGSEELILQLAADRAGWELDSVLVVPPGEHWTMVLTKDCIKNGFEYEKFDCNKKSPPANYNYNHKWSGRDAIIPFDPHDKIIVTIPDYSFSPFLIGTRDQGSCDLMIDGHEELAARSWFLDKEEWVKLYQLKKEGKTFVGTISQISPQAGHIYVKELKVAELKEVKKARNFDSKRHSKIGTTTQSYVLGYNNTMIKVATAEKFLSKGCYHCNKPLGVDDKYTWIKMDAALCGDCHNPVTNNNNKQVANINEHRRSQ